jgi:uncharacterized protein YunC (DUF1805 family)
MAIEVTPIKSHKDATGLSVTWEKGQYVMIVGKTGLISCGIADMKAVEEFSFAFAIAHGTPELPLVTPEDLLNAKVTEISTKAQEMGVKSGMTGAEALNFFL